MDLRFGIKLQCKTLVLGKDKVTYSTCVPGYVTFYVCLLLVVQQGKRKRSRPSTATNTPVKDGSSDSSGPVKNAEETNAEEETSERPVAVMCECKPTEEQTVTETSSTPAGSTPAGTPQTAAKEKPTKTSKERPDRKRDRRKERKSESGSPAMTPSECASPVCNGTSPDDMNVCKCV